MLKLSDLGSPKQNQEEMNIQEGMKDTAHQLREIGEVSIIYLERTELKNDPHPV